MWILVNICLLMMASASITYGLIFNAKNRNVKNKLRLYALLLSILVSLWCLSYGILGFTDRLDVAPFIRMVGVFSLLAFLLIDFFFVTSINGSEKILRVSTRVLLAITSFIDAISFSRPSVNTYYRMGNHTTWLNNEADNALPFHLMVVALYTLFGLLHMAVWKKNIKSTLEKKFALYILIANFCILFGAIPDTIIPAMGGYGIATSGIFGGLCSMVIWLGITLINDYELKLGNLADHIYRFIDAGVCVFDLDRKIVFANPYFRNLTSTDTGHFFSFSDVFEIDEEKENDIFNDSKESVYSFEAKLSCCDRWMSVRTIMALDRYSEPYCYICVMSDITKLINTNVELEKASAAKTNFLATVSHEIRTPINAIMGFDEMVIRNSDIPEVLHAADNIQRAGNRLLSIVNDILDMSKIEAGKMSIENVEYELSETVYDAYVMLVPKADEKNLEFTLINNPDIPNVLSGDDNRIGQILTNIVNNAIKYTEKGFIRLSVDYVPIDAENINLIFEVSDSGMGIKEENLPHIFEPFKRVEESKTRNIEGTGVGLSTTKYFVELMGGSITVKSEFGKGSTFTVKIPQKIVNTITVGDINLKKNIVEKMSHECLFTAKDARILVVDDSDMNLLVVVGLLKATKINIDTASDGFEALKKIKENKYDIILMDHMMPRMDGVEVIKRLKAENWDINVGTPIIVMTANAIVGAKEMYMEAGFTDYLPKPVNGAVLENTIKEYLNPNLISFMEEESDIEESINDVNVTKAICSFADLPSIPGIDWGKAYSISADFDLLVSVVMAFYTDAHRDIDDLDGFYKMLSEEDNADNIDSYRIKVHALKHCGQLIGDDSIFEKAYALEMAAKEYDKTTIFEKHQSFVEEYLSIAGALCKAFTGKELNAVSSDCESDISELKEELKHLESALENFDTEVINEIVSEMNLKIYPKDIEPVIKEVIRASLDLDMSKFLEKIGELNLE